MVSAEKFNWPNALEIPFMTIPLVQPLMQQGIAECNSLATISTTGKVIVCFSEVLSKHCLTGTRLDYILCFVFVGRGRELGKRV